MDVGSLLLWILDFGFWASDFLRILDFGFWILDFVLWV